MSGDSSLDEDLALSEWVDAICDEFEAAWRSLTPPRVEDYLGDVTGARQAALRVELDKLDRAYRRRLGLAQVAADTAVLPLTTPPAKDPATDWPAVPDYEILSELGRGGMGVVYQARQQSLPRLVALKVLPAGAGEERRQRFVAESAAVARLQHPNIVQVYEVGEQDGRPYLALEYMAGGSLARRLAGAPQPARAAAEVVETLARAVDYAHAQGIIHRDLKPANVLLTDDGTPKVSDFGLAKYLHGELGEYHTHTGEILGTPSYMAPEQTAGKPEGVGPAADTHALGAILYELLTGRPPFKGESTLDTLEQVRSQEPVSPRQLQPRLPRDLETVCLKAMAKEPGRRYATAAALADDLRRFLDGRPIQARPVGAAEKMWRWCRRNPAVTGLTVAVALAILAGTAVSSFYVAQADARARETIREEKNARRNAYVSAMRLARTYWEGAKVRWLAELLDRHRPEHAGGDDLRGFEWWYWHRLCHSGITLSDGLSQCAAMTFTPDSLQLLTVEENRLGLWDVTTGRLLRAIPIQHAKVRYIAFSPNGRRVALACEDFAVLIRDTEDGRLLHDLRGHTGDVWSLAFSPDGARLISVSGDGAVRLWDAEAGREAGSITLPREELGDVSFSRDINLLASGADGKVRLWDTRTGQLLRVLESPVRHSGGVAFSSDGKLVASAGADYTVRIWDAASGQQRYALSGHSNGVSDLAFSPDSRLLASTAHDGTVRTWDTTSGRPRRSFKGHTDRVGRVVFSPDGQRLASISENGLTRIWDVDADQEFRELAAHTMHVYCVAFSRDGRLLASGAGEENQPGEIMLWDVAQGRRLHAFDGHRSCVNGVSFSPDGRLLASASDDYSVLLWDVTERRPVRTLTGHTHKVWATAFSPDGRRLASAGEDRRVIVWAVQTGNIVLTIVNDHKLNSVAYSPDGQWLVTADWSQMAKIWHAASGAHQHTLKGHMTTVWSAVFSPDSRRVAAVGNDGTARLWDAATGMLLLTLRGHTRQVSGVAFSPDGRRLATAGWDEKARIWDTETGEELLTLAVPSGRVFTVAFSPDGHLLATGGGDKIIRLWEATPLVPHAASQEP